MSVRRLKHDSFGSINLLDEAGERRIRRDTGDAAFGLRWLARLIAAREARALSRLAGIDGVPALLAFDGRVLDRAYLDGAPMDQAQPRRPGFYREARRLLRALHARGVAHNDLAKEANWLVRNDGRPAVLDFQIALLGRPRAPWFRLLAREDLRHLLKHKRTYCPECLTPTERRLLARRSWLSHAWRASGKKLYIFVARRILRWEDNEGRGKKKAERL